MQTAGVRVFRGGHQPPYDMDDFIDLAQSSLPREARDTLMAMECRKCSLAGNKRKRGRAGSAQRPECGHSGPSLYHRQQLPSELTLLAHTVSAMAEAICRRAEPVDLRDLVAV